MGQVVQERLLYEMENRITNTISKSMSTTMTRRMVAAMETNDKSNITSIRIVSVDNYMRYPISGLDPCYSEFRGSEIKQVGEHFFFQSWLATCPMRRPWSFVPLLRRKKTSLISIFSVICPYFQGARDTNIWHRRKRNQDMYARPFGFSIFVCPIPRWQWPNGCRSNGISAGI